MFDECRGHLFKVPNIGRDELGYRYFYIPASDENRKNGDYFQGVPIDTIVWTILEIGKGSPLRSLCCSIDCQSVPPSHRLVNKHGRASAIFGYFSLSFPQHANSEKRYCVSKKHRPSGDPELCIDRAPSGVKAPAERKVYPKRHFIAVPVSLVLKPTTRREIQKTVQTIGSIHEFWTFSL